MYNQPRIGFRTRNLSLAEYQSLTEQERETFHELAWEENHAWLTAQLQEHGAAWLIVVDGQIIASSSDLDEYPTESEIMDIIEETGKFPFIFIDNAILSIEEGANDWHRTVYTDDFYIPRKVGVAVTLDFANHTTSVRLPETT